MALDGGLWGRLWRGAEDGDNPLLETEAAGVWAGLAWVGISTQAQRAGPGSWGSAPWPLLCPSLFRWPSSACYWPELVMGVGGDSGPVRREGGRENAQVVPGQGLDALAGIVRKVGVGGLGSDRHSHQLRVTAVSTCPSVGLMFPSETWWGLQEPSAWTC